MERPDLPIANPTSKGSPRHPSTALPAPIDNAVFSLDFSLGRLSTADAVGGSETRPSSDTMSAKRLSRLSLRELFDRIALLVELELPCAVYIPNAGTAQVHRVIRRIERAGDRLYLYGPGFSLNLHQHNADAIWLVNNPGIDHSGLVIEIHNRAGSLIARLFGAQDRVGSAIWHDVMGNLSFAAA